MSRTRGLALFAVLMTLGTGAMVITPSTLPESAERGIGAASVTPTWKLTEADSCNSVCAQECGGECGTAYTIGCNCYWLCPDGDPGEQLCTGAIGVRICS